MCEHKEALGIGFADSEKAIPDLAKGITSDISKIYTGTMKMPHATKECCPSGTHDDESCKLTMMGRQTVLHQFFKIVPTDQEMIDAFKQSDFMKRYPDAATWYAKIGRIMMIRRQPRVSMAAESAFGLCTAEARAGVPAAGAEAIQWEYDCSKAEVFALFKSSWRILIEKCD